MRRFLIASLFVFLCSVHVYGQTPSKLQGWCQTGNQTVSVPGGTGPSTNKFQRSYPQCTVTVFDAGTTNLSTIYSDSSSTAKGNPFTADTGGIWFFYAMDGKYDVKFSGAGISAPFTLGDFPMVNSNGGKGPWYINRGTLTNSTVASQSFRINVTDNSPPSGPAGVIGSTYVPDGFRFTVNSGTGGQSVGQNSVGLMEQGSTGKTYTTTTQVITGGVGAQTVSVGDSSVFIDPAVYPTVAALFCATIEPGVSATVECVTIISIPDATHIRAVFANNHPNPSVIGLRYKGAQATLAVTGNDVLTDGSGTPGNNDTFGINIGVQCKNATFHECDAIEIDTLNNSGTNAAYVGSGNLPVIYGGTIVSAGTNHSTYGLDITSGASASRFLTGIELGGIKDTAITIVNNGAGSVTTGLNVAAASTNGIIIGSNQSVPSAPGFPLSDPTNGIYLTAKGNAASAVSNSLCFEERVAGVNHPWCILTDGGGNMAVYRDGVYTKIGWVGASGTSTAQTFVATSTVDNTDPKVYVTDAAGSTVTAKMTALGDVMGTTLSTRQQCTSAASPAVCGATPTGHVTIAAGATTVTVNTTRVHRNGSSNSTILVTENSALGTPLGVTCNVTTGRTYTVTAMTDGTSFVITSSAAPAANPACLSYMIIN